MSSTTGEAVSPNAKAVRMVLMALSGDAEPSADRIRTAVRETAGVLSALGEPPVDPELVARDVERLTAVTQDPASGPSNSEKHEPWLPEARSQRSWDFWERYRWYLEEERGLPPNVVRRLHQSTDDVLAQLEDPRRPGRWHRRGLVIGQVQSGKTGHYIGLAAKAVDAGYPLIVILAGIHNDLRSQTQLRVDEGLLGFHTDGKKKVFTWENEDRQRIGAGRMPSARRYVIGSPTDSSDAGDFDARTANTMRNLPGLGDFPLVLVIKKHQQKLDAVREWLVDAKGVEGENGQRVVRDFPLLVIDDEADNASVNTAETDADPTRINSSIRQLLHSFERAAYVGYTATPFANIYIDPRDERDGIGADLFPESFVRSIPPPSNYFGPERVFGLRTTNEEEDVDPLPLFRKVNDTEEWLPARHKKEDFPSGDLPDSLREAVQAFVLSCAARRARGQKNVHNSMLVHVTRFVPVQGAVRRLLEEYVHYLRDCLSDRYGHRRQLIAEFQRLWMHDFEPTTAHFPPDEARRLSWREVSDELVPAVEKIDVRAVNGTARDALDYYEHRNIGLSVIAVGGQKLSRGLTLEGLTVSYYLRYSRTYDTLLQMGRWFGYRPGYEDLCRLYTSTELRDQYVEVTAAINELRREVEEMAELNLTPKQFGLKVRASTSRMLRVTAPNKMRNATRVLLTFSGAGPETTSFDLSDEARRQNLGALEDLVRRLDARWTAQQGTAGGTVTWKGVTPDVVTTFLRRYKPSRSAQLTVPAHIATYVENCARVGELQNWTVCLVGNRTAPRERFGEHHVGPVKRTALTKDEEKQTYTIRRVASPKDEQLGLDDAQVEAARAATRQAADRKGRPTPQEPPGEHLRLQRRPDQALLLVYPVQPQGLEKLSPTPPLVGFQVSFPHSEFQQAKEYVANTVWRRDQLPFDDEEDDE